MSLIEENPGVARSVSRISKHLSKSLSQNLSLTRYNLAGFELNLAELKMIKS